MQKLKEILSKLRQVITPLLSRLPRLGALAGKDKNTIVAVLFALLGNRERFRFYAWAAATYFLALFLMMLLVKIAFSGHALTELAVKNGQSVEIHLATGGVTGGNFGKAVSGSMETAPVNKIEGGDDLAAVPLPGLIEQTDKGILPAVAHDGTGTVPWRYYGRPFTSQDGKRPMIAIVFTNLGLSRPLTEEAMKLPHEFTLGFSPYASDAGKWAGKGRANGFESVIDLPVQTDNYPISDPGPFGLLEDLSPDENIARMHAILMQFPGFVGMLASEGEKMTANKDEIKPYLTELKRRGLLFLYVKTDKNTAFEDFTKANFFYALGIDKVIDTDISRSAIDAQLQSLITIARSQGYAIGLAHSYPPTVEELASWAPTLFDQGVDLVPVTAIGTKEFP